MDIVRLDKVFMKINKLHLKSIVENGVDEREIGKYTFDLGTLGEYKFNIKLGPDPFETTFNLILNNGKTSFQAKIDNREIAYFNVNYCLLHWFSKTELINVEDFQKFLDEKSFDGLVLVLEEIEKNIALKMQKQIDDRNKFLKELITRSFTFD